MTTETIVGAGNHIYAYDDNNQLTGWKDIAGAQISNVIKILLVLLPASSASGCFLERYEPSDLLQLVVSPDREGMAIA